MIELEIQTLSERREGLLIEVGRSVTASGFTLQRQRLTQGAHGVLLTMVVRGPPRKRRTLEAALDAHERVISFEVSEFVDGEPRPHFAESRVIHTPPVAPAPAAAVVSMPASTPADVGAAAVPAVAAGPGTMVPAVRADATTVARSEAIREAAATPEPVEPAMAEAERAEPELPLEQELKRFLPPPIVSARSPAPVAALPAPFVEIVPLAPDVDAVDRTMLGVAESYPDIVPGLRAMDRALAAGAREPSLRLAGQRTGTWIAERDHPHESGLTLQDAIAGIGVPALGQLVEVEQQGGQLHIRNSPLCTEDGHSGCTFFTGFLEGVLGPAIAPDVLSVFAVCCRACGADECVLALSD